MKLYKYVYEYYRNMYIKLCKTRPLFKAQINVLLDIKVKKRFNLKKKNV